MLVYYPPRRLTRPFINAVRASGLNQVKLASEIGEPARHVLRSWLRRELFTPTPKVLQRLEALALLVGYSGTRLTR